MIALQSPETGNNDANMSKFARKNRETASSELIFGGF